MSIKLLPRVAAAVALVALCGSAQAVPFVIEGAVASASGVGLGASVDLDEGDGLAGRYFDLDEGETSAKFDFLDVTVSGFGALGGTIEATLNFLQPSGAGATGVLSGFAVLLGLRSEASLEVISDPGQIAFGDGGLFDVDFFGFDTQCYFCGSLTGTIQATIKLVKAPTTSVPEPATLALLGAGLAALGFARRRKHA